MSEADLFFAKRPLPKFITTIELGRLARWLRILGYDCVFFERAPKRDIVVEALRQGRVILTRDAGLSRFSGTKILHIESGFIKEQLPQVLRALHLALDRKKMFTRCVKCNSAVERCGKEALKEKIPPHVYKTQDKFTRCAGCGRVFWKGTHWRLANGFLSKIAYG